MIYHGRFNAARFNVVEQPTEISVRDLHAETAEAIKPQLRNCITEIIPGNSAFSTSVTAAARFGVSAFMTEAVDGEAGELLPVVFLALQRRRGYNQERFNGTIFNHGTESGYIHLPESWKIRMEGAEVQLLNRIREPLAMGTGVYSSPVTLTVLYPFSAFLSEYSWMDAPELIPTVPLTLTKLRDLPGFNFLPFDGARAGSYVLRPLLWREDLDGRKAPIYGRLDGAAELSATLDGVLRLFLDCIIAGTWKDTLSGSPEVWASVPFGQRLLRRRGYNHARFNLADYNLGIYDRYIPWRHTWEAELSGRTGARIVPIGGAIDGERLKAILSCTGFPVAYNHFISAPEIPFIVFMRASSPNFHADNRVYQRINRWEIYLCTEYKSRASERVLENVLDLFEIPYTVTDEYYIKDERLYQIVYEFEELEV